MNGIEVTELTLVGHMIMTSLQMYVWITFIVHTYTI